MDFLIFLVVAIISFAGSIHLGGVNLAVVETTLRRNLSAGILVAIGGSIPEFIYSFLALKGLFFLQKNQAILDLLNFIIIPVFFIIGVFYLIQKQTKKPQNNRSISSKNIDFLKGFSLGMLNPQLLPFWFFMLVYLSKVFIINSLSSKYAFVLGTGFGAFAVLFLFAYFTKRYQNYFDNILKKYAVNQLMGLVFISLAVLQIFKVFA